MPALFLSHNPILLPPTPPPSAPPYHRLVPQDALCTAFATKLRSPVDDITPKLEDGGDVEGQALAQRRCAQLIIACLR